MKTIYGMPEGFLAFSIATAVFVCLVMATIFGFVAGQVLGPGEPGDLRNQKSYAFLALVFASLSMILVILGNVISPSLARIAGLFIGL